MTTVKTELKNLGEVYSTHKPLETCDSIEAIWKKSFPAERYNLAYQLIAQITLYTDPILIKRWNGRKLIISLENKNTPSEAEPTALARRLVQAYYYLKMLESGKYPTIILLAEAYNQDTSKLPQNPELSKIIFKNPKDDSRKQYAGIHDAGKTLSWYFC